MMKRKKETLFVKIVYHFISQSGAGGDVKEQT